MPYGDRTECYHRIRWYAQFDASRFLRHWILCNSNSYHAIWLVILGNASCCFYNKCPVRLVIGLPTLRLKGDYLAIATLGFGEIVRNVLNNWDSLTNGPMGIQRIPMPVILGYTINPYKKNMPSL